MIALRRPAPWTVVALLCVVGVFVMAGRWQYDKACHKRDQQAAWAAAGARPPVDIGDVVARDSGVDRVTAAGRWLAPRYLLDNQIRDGRPGVDVFAPLELTTGEIVLVALGWLPYADAGREAPVPPALPVDEIVVVNGTLAPPPAHGLRLGRNWADAPDFPKLMPYFAIEDVATDLRLPLAPRVLRADEVSGSPYRRDWRAIDSMPPERHLAYAWQWWSLAIAAVIVFVVLHRHRGTSP